MVDLVHPRFDGPSRVHALRDVAGHGQPPAMGLQGDVGDELGLERVVDLDLGESGIGIARTRDAACSGVEAMSTPVVFGPSPSMIPAASNRGPRPRPEAMASRAAVMNSNSLAQSRAVVTPAAR